MDATQEFLPPTKTLTEWSEVERPLLLQLAGMGWQIMSIDIDVPDLTKRGYFRRIALHNRPVNLDRTKGR